MDKDKDNRAGAIDIEGREARKRGSDKRETQTEQSQRSAISVRAGRRGAWRVVARVVPS